MSCHQIRYLSLKMSYEMVFDGSYADGNEYTTHI